MKNDRPVKNFDDLAANLYPHLKITNEDFPRVLATRKIEDDGVEYFGAFLPKTAVRILIDFLGRTFRLRSCDIEINGHFNVPCTQFYERRCLGPCVASLCDRESYLEMVSLVRLFLANRRDELLELVHEKIRTSSDKLDFETAAFWRDLIEAVEKFWENPRLRVWLEDTVDTYAVERSERGLTIFLATQRGKRVLGRKVFSFAGGKAESMIRVVIESFYRFHLPKEIRVLEDFEGRQELAEKLSERFGRKARIVVIDPEDRRLSTAFALTEALSESELDAVRTQATPQRIAQLLKSELNLKKKPARIEAFDVAHISGRGFAAACSVAESAKFSTSEYYFQISPEKSELDALSAAIRDRLVGTPKMPDLILVDGGKSQLASVVSAVREAKIAVSIVAAVKPRSKHSEISHFILESGETVEFDASSPAHNFLKLLRDEAHDLANRVHRDLRDMGHHYELAAILPSINEGQRRRLLAAVGSLRKILAADKETLSKLFGPMIVRHILRDLEKYRAGKAKPVLPLIVPLRFVAENSAAEDLRPIPSIR